MKSSGINVIMLLVLLSASLFRILTLPSTVLSIDELPLILATVFITLLITFLPKEELPWMKRRYLTISNIFLLAFVIVHFQEYLDLVLIPNNEKRLTTYSDQFITVRAAYISLSGVISYCIGLCFSRSKNTIWYSNKPHWHTNFDTLGKISSFSYFVFLLLFIMVNGRTYLSGAYSQETLESMSGSLSTYTVVLLSACFLATVLSVSLRLSSNSYTVSLRRYLAAFSPFFYFCVIVYLFFVISFGDRGPVITSIMTFAGGYLITSKKRINAFLLTILLVIAATVVSVWGVMRSDRDNAVSFQERTDELYSNGQSVFPPTAELAGSNRVTIMAVESTPSQYPFRRGLFTINNLISIIPFSSSIVRLLGVNVPKNLAHSSAFMNWYDHGDRLQAGVGTTTVADFYLDFGVAGVILCLFLLGLLFRKIDASVYALPLSNISPFLTISFIVLFSQAIYLPRSVTLFQLRNIVWDFIIVVLFSLLARKKK